MHAGVVCVNMLLLNLLFVCMYMREREKKGKEKKIKKKGISPLVIRIFFFALSLFLRRVCCSYARTLPGGVDKLTYWPTRL